MATDKELEDRLNTRDSEPLIAALNRAILDVRNMDADKRDLGSVELNVGSWKAIFRGIDTKIVLLAILFIVGLGAVAWNWNQDRRIEREARTAYLEQHKITQSMIVALTKSNEALAASIIESRRNTQETINEVTYMLTLNQKNRENLRMEMPYSLRKKINER